MSPRPRRTTRSTRTTPIHRPRRLTTTTGDHDAEHAQETHADLDADYRFECRDAARIGSVEVRLFEALPATQRLRVQHATAKGQGGAELTAAHPRIEL